MTLLLVRVVGGAVVGPKYASFQQKSYWIWIRATSNFTVMENLRHFAARVGCDFLLKIGINRAKGSTKNVPVLKACDSILAPPTALSIKVAIVVLYFNRVLKFICLTFTQVKAFELKLKNVSKERKSCRVELPLDLI